MTTFTLLDDERVHETTARIDGDAVVIAPTVLGWKVDGVGLCK